MPPHFSSPARHWLIIHYRATPYAICAKLLPILWSSPLYEDVPETADFNIEDALKDFCPE